jgi:hypothetical protein
MAEDLKHNRDSSPDRDGWSEPMPAHIPRPTYWPAVMALGITFIFFGVVTQWAFTAAGAGMVTLAAAKWIGELLDGD